MRKRITVDFSNTDTLSDASIEEAPPRRQQEKEVKTGETCRFGSDLSRNIAVTNEICSPSLPKHTPLAKTSRGFARLHNRRDGCLHTCQHHQPRCCCDATNAQHQHRLASSQQDFTENLRKSRLSDVGGSQPWCGREYRREHPGEVQTACGKAASAQQARPPAATLMR